MKITIVKKAEMKPVAFGPCPYVVEYPIERANR